MEGSTEDSSEGSRGLSTGAEGPPAEPAAGVGAGAQPVPKRREGPFSRALCPRPAPAALRRGVEQLNRGELFEQHETLEELWRAEPDDVRYLYQGILLVGVGAYHVVRGNHAGAAATLERGLGLLRWFEPTCQEVDVARLVADAERALAELRARGPARLAEFDRRWLPRVSWASHAEAPRTEPRAGPGDGV